MRLHPVLELRELAQQVPGSRLIDRLRGLRSKPLAQSTGTTSSAVLCTDLSMSRARRADVTAAWASLSSVAWSGSLRHVESIAIISPRHVTATWSTSPDSVSSPWTLPQMSRPRCALPSSSRVKSSPHAPASWPTACVCVKNVVVIAIAHTAEMRPGATPRSRKQERGQAEHHEQDCHPAPGGLQPVTQLRLEAQRG